MERLKRVSPVPPSVALLFGKASGYFRRGTLHQCRIGKAVAFFAGETPVALAMFDTRRARRAELAIGFMPAARHHMRALIREAQLTLPAIRQSRIVLFARIAPVNKRGRRMARLAGFEPAGFGDPEIWFWRGS